MTAAAVELAWIPLGAGGRFVASNGRVFEAIQAARRPPPRGRAPGWSAGLALARRDNPQISVRPVAPGDLPRLDALMSGLDDQARFRRWFTGAADVHRAAAWAAHPESDHGVGLVAIDPEGELVGHAALIPIDTERGEVCFEVAAPWRHHGIAGRFLAELERCAATRGLRTLVADVLPENADMLAVLREHGPCREHRDGGVLELELAVGAGFTKR